MKFGHAQNQTSLLTFGNQQDLERLKLAPEEGTIQIQT